MAHQYAIARTASCGTAQPSPSQSGHSACRSCGVELMAMAAMSMKLEASAYAKASVDSGDQRRSSGFSATKKPAQATTCTRRPPVCERSVRGAHLMNGARRCALSAWPACTCTKKMRLPMYPSACALPSAPLPPASDTNAHPEKARSTPKDLSTVSRSYPTITAIVIVNMGSEDCQMAAAVAPSTLTPTM